MKKSRPVKRKIKKNISKPYWRVVIPIFIALVVGVFGIYKLVDTNATEPILPYAGTEFRIVQFNVKFAGAAADTIVKPSNKFDVIGMQELDDPHKFNIVKDTLKRKGFAVYPTKPSRPNRHTSDFKNGLHGRAIAYNTARFEFVSGSEFTYERMKGARAQKAHSPILRLRDKSTGQQFFVLNIHGTAWGPTGNANNNVNGLAERYGQAKIYKAQIAKLVDRRLPMFLTGDFNEGYGPDDNDWQRDPNKIFHCMITSAKLMKNAHVVHLNERPSKYCRANPEWDGRIDQIYVSPEVEVLRWRSLNGSRSMGTDHAIVPYADVKVVENTCPPGYERGARITDMSTPYVCVEE